MFSVEDMGHAVAAVAGGKNDFDAWFKNSGIPEADQQEAKAFWDKCVAHKEANPRDGISAPSDF